MRIRHTVHACVGDIMYTNPLDFSHVCIRASQFTKEEDQGLGSLCNIPTAQRLGEVGVSPEQPDFGTYSGLLDRLPIVHKYSVYSYTRELVRLQVLGHI